MNRKFAMLGNNSIKFGEDVLQLQLSDATVTQIRSGRCLVTFNKVNVRVLDLLFDYNLTEDEVDQIRGYLWQYFFLVSRSH